MPRKNYKAASKAAIHRGKVAQLDGIGANMNDFTLEEELNVIENVLGDFIVRVKANIDKEKDMVTTGKIGDISLKSDDNGVHVMGSPHLIYQDRGVNGAKTKLYPNSPHAYTDKRPPVAPILEWIKRKNINTVNNETYYADVNFKEQQDDEAKQKALAYAIREKIYQEGFRPRKLYSREIPELIEDLQEQIANFTVQMIVQNIDIKPSAKRIIVTK